MRSRTCCTSTFLGSLAATLVLSACGTAPMTMLFFDDFKADTVGQLPVEEPPGPPDGDYVFYAAAQANDALATRQVAVVNSDELGQALMYTNEEIPLYERYLGFISAPTAPKTAETIYAYWDAFVDLDAEDSALRISLGNSRFVPLALMELKNGDVRVQTSEGTPPTFESIGHFLNGVRQFVTISVDRKSASYSISIAQKGGPTIATGPRKVLSESALSTTRPSIALWYSEDLHGAGQYILDNVTISRSPPQPTTSK